jgi:hypothetical protein
VSVAAPVSSERKVAEEEHDREGRKDERREKRRYLIRSIIFMWKFSKLCGFSM